MSENIQQLNLFNFDKEFYKIKKPIRLISPDVKYFLSASDNLISKSSGKLSSNIFANPTVIPTHPLINFPLK